MPPHSAPPHPPHPTAPHPTLPNTQAPDDDLALQRLMSLTRNKSSDAFNTLTQQQLDAAAANAEAMHRRVSRGGGGRYVSLWGRKVTLRAMVALPCVKLSSHSSEQSDQR
jgi:hypothetical protein